MNNETLPECPFCGPPHPESKPGANDGLTPPREERNSWYCSGCQRDLKRDVRTGKWAHDLSERSNWPSIINSSPREGLIEAFGGDENARSIVDALDTYLHAGIDQAPVLLDLTPNYRTELERTQVELEAARKQIEELERKLQAKQ